jgi:hypothetical protein
MNRHSRFGHLPDRPWHRHATHHSTKAVLDTLCWLLVVVMALVAFFLGVAFGVRSMRDEDG